MTWRFTECGDGRDQTCADTCVTTQRPPASTPYRFERCKPINRAFRDSDRPEQTTRFADHRPGAPLPPSSTRRSRMRRRRGGEAGSGAERSNKRGSVSGRSRGVGRKLIGSVVRVVGVLAAGGGSWGQSSASSGTLSSTSPVWRSGASGQCNRNSCSSLGPTDQNPANDRSPSGVSTQPTSRSKSPAITSSPATRSISTRVGRTRGEGTRVRE